jgi:ankyrin repeat protein
MQVLFICKKVTLSICLMLVWLGAFVINATEQQIPSTEQKAEEEANSLTNLPPEINAHIISFLADAKNIEEAIKNIKSLSLTSKELPTLINNSQVLGSLILDISKKFNVSPVDVALAFSTTGASSWLKEYIKQNPQAKEILDQQLLEAIELENHALVEILINAGANVNKANDDGWTPLLKAIIHGNEYIVELLLETKADVNKADSNGMTPLCHAVLNKDKDIVELLLNAKADVNTPNAKADVNKRDIYSTTPLHLAVINGGKDIVKLLLKAGANVNTKDYQGKTPLTIATKYHKKKIVKLLHEFGATK